jgi:hypothetical protein
MQQAGPDLLGSRRREYSASDTRRKEAVTDEAGESRFMARAPTADDRNIAGIPD